MSKLLIATFLIILTLSASAGAEDKPEKGFCKRNPDAGVCKTAVEARKEERQKLEEQCALRPNTEECKAFKQRKEKRKKMREVGADRLKAM